MIRIPKSSLLNWCVQTPGLSAPKRMLLKHLRYNSWIHSFLSHAHAFSKVLRIQALDHTKSLCARIRPCVLCLLDRGWKCSWTVWNSALEFFARKFLVLGRIRCCWLTLSNFHLSEGCVHHTHVNICIKHANIHVHMFICMCKGGGGYTTQVFKYTYVDLYMYAHMYMFISFKLLLLLETEV